MASILDIAASSDSEDDVDYVPPTNGAASDSSCDEELLSDDEGFRNNNSGELVKATHTKKRKEADDKGADATAKVDEKERAKELWESFLSDVESVTPKSNTAVCNSNTTNLIPSENGTKAPKINSKKSASKVFEFAGETITHTVGKDLGDKTPSFSEKNLQPEPPMENPPCMPIKRGIDSILGTISNKNKKLTVLEKSKLDWVSFKEDEGLDNELEKFNKGRQGFLERKRFLERSDLRSFEIEKSMRQTLRKK